MLTSFWERKNERFFLFYFVTTGACCVASEVFLKPVEMNNFYIGQLIFGLSFLGVVFSVYFFFLKKSIALFLVLIVLKWPVLIYIVYQMTRLTESRPFYLSAGVFPLFLSVFLWSFAKKGNKET